MVGARSHDTSAPDTAEGSPQKFFEIGIAIFVKAFHIAVKLEFFVVHYRSTLLRGFALFGCVLLAGCGAPELPDMRSVMSESISRLGMRPIYPLQENRRLGMVLLVDAAAAKPHSGLPPWQETSILLTNELDDRFERARLRLQRRFPRSSSTLNTALDATTGRVFYRQSSAGNSDPVPKGSLSIAAMPGYTLASVDQATLAAAVPNIAASFFASIGLRSTTYLKIEPSAVEVAEIPFDEVRDIVITACEDSSDGTQFSMNGTSAKGTVAAAVEQLEQWRGERVSAKVQQGEQVEQAEQSTPAVQPYLTVLRRVFYLRGIRFIIEDTRVAAAFAQAAIAQNFPAGSQVVALPAIATASASAGTGPTAPQSAAIADLQKQIDQLRTNLANAGSNIQIATSFARATAVGIVLEQIFDRPLAFGYQAFFTDARIDRNKPAIDFSKTPPESYRNLNGFANICDRV